MILNNIDNAMLGASQVEKIMCGSVTVWENFPAELQKVEYIEATGSQYLDTGLIFDTVHYKYNIECEMNNENGNQLFGMYYGYCHGVDIWDGVYQFCDTNSTIINTPFSAGTKLKINVNHETKTISGESSSNTFSHTFTGDFFPSSSVYPVILGGCWTSWDNTFRSFGKGKIYGFEYFAKDVQDTEYILKGKFIPCYRKSDNKAGLYDIVRKQFLTSATSTDFVLPT